MTTTPLYYYENITNPTEFILNSTYEYDDTTFCLGNRPKHGWTIDFVFNMGGQIMTSGNTFYYWGVKNETNPEIYVDNNLSFGFTVDGRIRWRKSVYGNCGDDNSIVEEFGKTPVLCSGGTSDDFNVTIVFTRNFEYDDCDLPNMGGENDLFTGWTVTNTLDIVTGATPIQTTVLALTDKWYQEKFRRLGTLKIYLNGRLVYKNKQWEEVIPTIRTSGNTIVQIWGGGTSGSGEIHTGTCAFEIKRIAYYDVPLTHMEIRDNYLELVETYSINECTSGCDEIPIS